MKRYLHKFNTNEHRSQYEGGVEYISPYTSLVYEDDSVHYNVFKAQLTLTNGHVITIPQNGNNTDSALTSAEIAEYKADIVDVVVGNRVKTLGSGVLSGCTNLENIEFSNSVTTIGSQSFRGCVGLTNVEMPNNVTTIGASAFTSCSKLTEIKIPSGITTINDYTFSSCSLLADIDVSNISVGDILVKGRVDLDIEEQSDLKDYEVYIITSINNNNFGSTPHVHIEGK